MRLRFSNRALEQIGAIHNFIAQDNPAAAVAMVGRIRAAAQRLSRFPRIGRSGVVPGTLEWVVRGFPYIVVYEIDEQRDELTILNVFHGAQER